MSTSQIEHNFHHVRSKRRPRLLIKCEWCEGMFSTFVSEIELFDKFDVKNFQVCCPHCGLNIVKETPGDPMLIKYLCQERDRTMFNQLHAVSNGWAILVKNMSTFIQSHDNSPLLFNIIDTVYERVRIHEEYWQVQEKLRQVEKNAVQSDKRAAKRVAEEIEEKKKESSCCLPL